MVASISLTVSAAAAPIDTPANSEHSKAEAQYRIAVMYDNGDGFKRDYKKAAEWYARAAEQGHADSQNNLGVMYARGEGVRMNPTKARQLFKQAAAQNQRYAEHNIKEIDKLKQSRMVSAR